MVASRSILSLVRTPTFWRDRWVLVLLGLALATNIATFGYVAYRYSSLPEFLPLHYNAAGDVDYIGTRLDAFRIPAIGLVVWVVNLAASLLLYSREELASRMLLVIAASVQVMILAAVIAIVY